MLFSFPLSFLIGLQIGHSRSVREFFSQVYTLHSLVQDRFLPGINAFLPDKSEDTYCRLFEEVSNILDLENPLKGVITGFEIAAVYAAAATFEGTEIKGCIFHLCLNMWKRI